MGRYGTRDPYVEAYRFPEGQNLMPFVETFRTPGNFRHTIGKETYDQWMDLDRVLIRLWESNAIHTQVTYCAEVEGGMACQYIGSLFPEMRERGLVEMVYDTDLF